MRFAAAVAVTPSAPLDLRHSGRTPELPAANRWQNVIFVTKLLRGGPGIEVAV
jgi:hypothetical protein